MWKSVIISIVFCYALIFQLSAQENAFAYVDYKFEVLDLTDKSDSKELMTVLADEPIIVEANYLEDCHCFKITSTQVLDYSSLATIIQRANRTLGPKVQSSSGEILLNNNQRPQAQRE